MGPAAVPLPAAAALPEPVSLRQVLTFLTHWRLNPSSHPVGIFPAWLSSRGVSSWMLGPEACQEYPLLSDDQILGLLCEGSEMERSTLAAWPEVLAALHLDERNDAARDRATLLASVVLAMGEQGARARPRGRCPLAWSLAAFAHLIANIGPDFWPMAPGPDSPEHIQPVLYPVGSGPVPVHPGAAIGPVVIPLAVDPADGADPVLVADGGGAPASINAGSALLTAPRADVGAAAAQARGSGRGSGRGRARGTGAA